MWSSRAAEGGGQERRRQPSARTVTVEVVEASTGSLRERLLLTGALKPTEDVDVTPKVTGRIDRILVHVGDRVAAGALLAQIEDAELEQQVRRATAALAVTRASLSQREAEQSNASAELERAQSLRDSGLISAQEFSASRTQHEVVRAQVELARAQQEQAQAELNELKIRLAQSRLYSPMSGEVASRFVDPGALVSPTTPIVKVVNIDRMVVAANVPEQQVAKLRVGARATVHVDAYTDRPFDGRVARIGPVLDPATRSATVEIEIANPERRLRAEMFARVDLNLDSTRQAVLVPRDALVYRGTQAGVFLAKGDQPVFQPVETGQTQASQVELLSGIAPGTLVVGRGASMIQEGDRIATPRSARTES